MTLWFTFTFTTPGSPLNHIIFCISTLGFPHPLFYLITDRYKKARFQVPDTAWAEYTQYKDSANLLPQPATLDSSLLTLTTPLVASSLNRYSFTNQLGMYSGDQNYMEGNWYIPNGGNYAPGDQQMYVGDLPSGMQAAYGTGSTNPSQANQAGLQAWQGISYPVASERLTKFPPYLSAPTRHQPANFENAVYMPYQGAGYVPAQPNMQAYYGSSQQPQSHRPDGQPIQVTNAPLYAPRPTPPSRVPPPRPPTQMGYKKPMSSGPSRSSVNGYLAPPSMGRERKNSVGSDHSNSSGSSTTSNNPSKKGSKAPHPPGMPQPKSNRVPYTWVSRCARHCGVF